MVDADLLDLGGVVYVGDKPLPGALEAIERLRAAGLGLRFITNTTRTPRARLLEKLRAMGLAVNGDDLFMPAIAARRYLETQKLSPHLLVHPALEEDFAGLPATGEKAVVIGDAAEGFTYGSLNQAFRLLNQGAPFLALARNRTFQDADGKLSLDAGPFVAALEFATARTALLLGKPSADFFQAAVDSLDSQPARSVMVGDDVEADIAGAMELGLRGLLVRTGKYRSGDETRIDPPPTAVYRDLAEAIESVLDAGHNEVTGAS